MTVFRRPNSRRPAKVETGDIRTLQSLAAEAARSPAPPRAGALQRIDRLAQNSELGLAAMAGAAIFAVGVSLAAAPPIAAIWTAAVVASTIVARCLERDFRLGGASTRRPFRWRRAYTASLAALSAATGAGALFFAAAGVPLAPLAGLVIVLGLTLGGVAHRHHPAAAFTAAAPGLVFAAAGAALEPGGALHAVTLGAAAAGLATTAAATALSRRGAADPGRKRRRRRPDDGDREARRRAVG